MSFMFLKHPKILLQFIELPLITMYFLSFILTSFLLMIGSRGKPFFKANLEEASTLFHVASPQLQPDKSSAPARFPSPDGMPV
jgi:hypothetical protein